MPKVIKRIMDLCKQDNWAVGESRVGVSESWVSIYGRSISLTAFALKVHGPTALITFFSPASYRVSYSKVHPLTCDP